MVSFNCGVTSENYAIKAEEIIKSLGDTKLTTSKIRKLLSMVSEIYNDVQAEAETTLPSKLQNRINYLSVRMIYEAGRDQTVKNFIERSHLQKMIKEIIDDKKKFILFCHYFEALVAYHRFYGGEDQ